MKKHIFMTILASMPIASHTFFSPQELYAFMEEQERLTERFIQKAYGHKRTPTLKESHTQIEEKETGVILSIKDIDTKTIDVHLEEGVLHITLGDMHIHLRQAAHATQQKEYLLIIDIKEEVKTNTEKDGERFASYSHTSSRNAQQLKYAVDFEKAHPKYDASQKLFTLEIPYKETKSIAVEIVNE